MGTWMARPMRMVRGSTAMKTKAMGPPMYQNMAMKMTMKGRSTKLTRVAEVKKSRSTSSSRSRLAKEPTEAGLSLRRMFSSWSKSLPSSSTSIFFPVLSMKCARRVLMMKSKTKTMATPMARTQSVSRALLGTTRS